MYKIDIAAPILYTTLMYVRWQSRKCAVYKSRHSPFSRDDVHHAAILVESRRVNDAPRQQHIAYLCGFTTDQITNHWQRYHVWNYLARRLDQLANKITPADRAMVERAIARRVPRPTPAELEQCMAELGLIGLHG